MNTMADGAHDRLVAQIGEALFGQPGLTLMELAEMVKGMRSPFLLEEEPLPADMRLGSTDYLDYLNDQASPAGQDAHELWAMAQLVPGEGIEDGVRLIEAALAARQPVGISADWVLGYFDTDLPERARDAVRYAFAEYASLAALEPKPAQAVDLGQLPRAVELLSNVSRSLVDWAADEQREAIGIINALIDKAVGK